MCSLYIQGKAEVHSATQSFEQAVLNLFHDLDYHANTPVNENLLFRLTSGGSNVVKLREKFSPGSDSKLGLQLLNILNLFLPRL